MIKLFSATTTSFLSNGDKVLKPYKCKVKHDESFYLQIECDLSYSDWMVEGNIIVCPTPQGEQAFRISNVEKTGTKISAKCFHVFYDTKRYLIEDSYVVEKDGANALAWLNSASEPESPFTTFSDISVIDSYRCVRESLYDAILTVQKRWGGYLYLDNFSISLLSSVGEDNGITVRYRKNLREISVSENWDSVVTKLLPVGKDGILLNAIDPNVPVYVTSQRQYDIPYVRTVTFEQDISQDAYVNPDGTPDEYGYKRALLEDLWTQAQSYLEKNSVPQVNYSLKASIDRNVNIGDTIDVIDERLGVDIMTEVISYEYDCLTEKITSLEFGNFRPSLSGFSNQITAKVDQTVKTATDQIIGTMSDSYVIYNGSEILVVDRLPKSTASSVIKIGGSGGISISHNGISGTFTPIIGLDGSIGYSGTAVMSPDGLQTAFTGDVITVENVLCFAYGSFSLTLPEVFSGLDPDIIELQGTITRLDGTSVATGDLSSYVTSFSLSGNILTVNLSVTDACSVNIEALSVEV